MNQTIHIVLAHRAPCASIVVLCVARENKNSAHPEQPQTALLHTTNQTRFDHLSCNQFVALDKKLQKNTCITKTRTTPFRILAGLRIGRRYNIVHEGELLASGFGFGYGG